MDSKTEFNKQFKQLTNASNTNRFSLYSAKILLQIWCFCICYMQSYLNEFLIPLSSYATGVMHCSHSLISATRCCQSNQSSAQMRENMINSCFLLLALIMVQRQNKLKMFCFLFRNSYIHVLFSRVLYQLLLTRSSR